MTGAIICRQCETSLIRETHRFRGESLHVQGQIPLPVFSERWLNRRLAAFRQFHPGTSLQIEFHNDLGSPAGDDIDAWILYSNGDHPGCRVTHLFGEELVPVCSPSLRRSLPAKPNAEQIARLPLLHDIYWKDDWQHWADAMRVPEIDLSGGLRFGLYSGVIQSAIDGMGIAIGHLAMIDEELKTGRLVALTNLGLRSRNAYHLVLSNATARARRTLEFRDWLELESTEYRSQQTNETSQQ